MFTVSQPHADRSTDAVLDGLARAAARACAAPMALVSLAPGDERSPAARIGLPATDALRDLACRARTLLVPGEPREVADAVRDARFRSHPWVAGPPGIRFCAARPLVDADGTVLGALCTFDKAPRRLSDAQREALDGLARVTADLVRERRDSAPVAIHRAIEQAVRHGVLVTDPRLPDNPIVHVNEAFERMTGYERSELLGRNCRLLQGPDTDRAAVATLREAIAAGQPATVVLRNYRKDGTPFWNELTVSPVRDRAGRTVNHIGVQQDVTARLEAEKRLLHARRIDALGQLSGGIAHDFNNLLNVILGNLEFLGRCATEADRDRCLDEAAGAARMGARLTRRLLSFARQGELEAVVLCANDPVHAAVELLRSTLGRHVRLNPALLPDLWLVRADPSEVESAIVNLVINARDAMPEGGQITVETGNVGLCAEGASDIGELPAGDYVRLSVADTGTGMTPEVRARAFEPFFTTKEPGHGTGLGLASTHGFVTQSGGHVAVHSEPERGTTVHLYLPRHVEPSDARAVRTAEHAAPSSGGARVLVIEDDEMVRRLTLRRLTALGFEAHEAANGPEAVELFEAGTSFDLALTDIVMDGGMSGHDVARWIRRHAPRCRILLTSGFDRAAVEGRDARADADAPQLLRKPYDLAELRRAVETALDGASDAG